MREAISSSGKLHDEELIQHLASLTSKMSRFHHKIGTVDAAHMDLFGRVCANESATMSSS